MADASAPKPLELSRYCVPFTPFSGKLEEVTLCLVTTAAVRHRDDRPFDTAGDVTFRTIGGDVEAGHQRLRDAVARQRGADVAQPDSGIVRNAQQHSCVIRQKTPLCHPLAVAEKGRDEIPHAPRTSRIRNRILFCAVDRKSAPPARRSAMPHATVPIGLPLGSR